MQQLLRNLWATFRAWLAGQFMSEPPTVPPVEPEEEENEYHTMDNGQEAAVTKGPGYDNGNRR